MQSVRQGGIARKPSGRCKVLFTPMVLGIRPKATRQCEPPFGTNVVYLGGGNIRTEQLTCKTLRKLIVSLTVSLIVSSIDPISQPNQLAVHMMASPAYLQTMTPLSSMPSQGALPTPDFSRVRRGIADKMDKDATLAHFPRLLGPIFEVVLRKIEDFVKANRKLGELENASPDQRNLEDIEAKRTEAENCLKSACMNESCLQLPAMR